MLLHEINGQISKRIRRDWVRVMVLAQEKRPDTGTRVRNHVQVEAYQPGLKVDRCHCSVVFPNAGSIIHFA